MKDSDLVIPARPGPVANGPAPPSPPEQEKRGPGRPAGFSPKSNVKAFTTERLIDLKRELEDLLASVADDQESIAHLAGLQLMVLDIERMLIKRRTTPKP